MTEPFATIGFLAAVTTNVRLGTGVLLVPQRNPVYTAKSVTTVDWLSHGRVDLGIGVGWLAEEFAALGVPFDHAASGATSTSLSCDRSGPTRCPSSTASTTTFRRRASFPKPLQQPHPPIHVGGESNAALRRAARLCEGWYGYNLDPRAAAERITRLRSLIADAGRSTEAMSWSACARTCGPSVLRRSTATPEAGVDQLVLLATIRSTDDIERVLDPLAAVMAEHSEAERASGLGLP